MTNSSWELDSYNSPAPQNNKPRHSQLYSLSQLCLFSFYYLHVSRDVHHCTYLFGGKATFVYVAGLLLLVKMNVRRVYFWMFVGT